MGRERTAERAARRRPAAAWRCGDDELRGRRSGRQKVLLVAVARDGGRLASLTVEEPADRVEYFSGLVVEAGLGMTRQSAQQMLEWFCSRRVCRRGLTRPLT